MDCRQDLGRLVMLAKKHDETVDASTFRFPNHRGNLRIFSMLIGVFSNFLQLSQVDKSVAEAVLHRLFALLQDGAMEPWTGGGRNSWLDDVRLC